MTFRFAARRYALPFRHPVRTAHGLWTTREGIIVRISDESGAAGYGEAAPIAWFGTETVDEIEAVCREVRAEVDAERLDAIPGTVGLLRGAVAAARGMLRLRARSGASEEGTRAKDYLPVAALLPAGRAVLDAVGLKAETGFRTFKWKVGVSDIGDELSLLDDLIAKLPNGSKLRLDANGAWDRRKAERWLERCADRPVEFVEQPIDAAARGADDLLLGLAGDFPTPVALDESVTGMREVERWIGAGWPGFFVIKPSLLGDAESALEKLKAAKAKVIFSSALETGIGAREALRVAFEFGGETRALGFGVWPLFEDARFDGPHLAPFIRAEDVERMNPEAIWNALS
ncbi:o-succinylbenzoate synthase [Nibricoccus aquaticus]|uniref:o-succinylbenzoate synthase n=1 Tax=Nibricoccus aquaticus TaxID=2576891 RepID=A0A290QAC5_9BACT|nr:o-succinylbenzoate synthase [Nibricoccus aquaticus]ATC65373.1 o-succinylbenzoate synthase [Nibricoccus aquaticus]